MKKLILAGLLAGIITAKASEPTAAGIDWPAFLGRNDPVWVALPKKFDHGAFAGNGMLGTTVFLESANALRFAMGRSDVTSHARDNARLLMGGLRLSTKGKIIGGELRTDLWNAEIRGTVATESGSVTFRAFVDATKPLVVIDVAGTGAEADCDWTWMPEKAATGNASYDNFPDLANPPSESGQTDGVQWCEQKRTAGGSYTTAWLKASSRVLLTIADTFPQDDSRQAAIDTIRRAATESADERLRLHRAWWHADRKRERPRDCASDPDVWQFLHDALRNADIQRHSSVFERIRHPTQCAIPVDFHRMIPGVIAAFLGAKLDNSTGRVWFHPPAPACIG